MENLEFKSNEKGQHIAVIKDAYAAKTDLNIEMLVHHLGDFLADKELELNLAQIGMRYAMMAIESTRMCCDESRIQSDLSFLETLLDAISLSKKAPDYRKEIKRLKVALKSMELNHNSDLS